jgi:ferrochelatase
MTSKKKGVLLVNLGTPDSPSTADVRSYLKQFLLDPRVIDIPAIPRNLLVRGIIAPFRAPKSAATYRKIWTEEGSPLMVYSQRLLKKVQAALGEDYCVALAMRYKNPSIEQGLAYLKEQKCACITVVPLFPQYASATNGSIIELVMSIVGEWQSIPEITFSGPFYHHPLFIKAIAQIGATYDPASYDHILFSYHGVPERQIHKGADGNACLAGGCCDTLHTGNALCYRAQCFETTRRIAQALSLPSEKITTCFQSRLGKTPWIQPYASETIEKLAAAGKKSILVFSPAFVADCLETIYEIGVEYHEEFRHLGGNKVQLVESLNDDDTFVACLVDIVS